MNYDQAREIPGVGWHWTTMNDGIVRTAQPCVSFLKPFNIEKPFEPMEDSDIVRCKPHATREEAERHFYDWCLTELKESEWTTAFRCEAVGCEIWANKTLENRGMGGYFNGTFLCDEHRNADIVAILRPFKPGIELIHS